MATDYTCLYRKYPEVISADQLYQICHISKRKAKWLLNHGVIPCQDSGKKTRRYKIKLSDVIQYLYACENAPDTVAPPVGEFNVKRKQLSPISQINKGKFCQFLHRVWLDESDALSVSNVRMLLGYRTETIRNWMAHKKLRSIRLPDGTQVVAKEWLVEFTTAYTIRNPRNLSKKNRELAEKYLYPNVKSERVTPALPIVIE